MRANKNIAKLDTGHKKLAAFNTNTYLSLINALPDHIAVIDTLGNILHINKHWSVFAERYGNPPNDWKNVNYLEICDQSAASGDAYAMDAAQGIRDVISGSLEEFELEYPCHDLTEERWFIMRVNYFDSADEKMIVISHHNITKSVELAKKDSLLGIANRRRFEEFLAYEWKRSLRNQQMISLALIDLDNFKTINDTYGHEVGDDCLRATAQIIAKHTKRFTDISARIGGDELAAVWCDTDPVHAKNLAQKICNEISAMRLDTPDKTQLSVSIGFVSAAASQDNDIKTLTSLADQRLYQAKTMGRNRVCAD